MENKKIFSVTGLFDTADDIIHAAETVAESGYKKWDTNTPYPVHGLDHAMKIGPSQLGYWTLLFGLGGAAIALFGMWWIMAVEYPLVIGGKPFFPLPAFIPITFEVTVLLGSLGTVAVMIFIYFKLPNNSHPLHDTDYMKAVSVDKFGLCIEAKDPKFDESEARDILTKLGASNIDTIYWDESEVQHNPKVFSSKFLWGMGIVVVLTAGISYFMLNKVPFISPWNFMLEQERLDAQEKSEFFKDGFGMRPPVEGTIARGFLPVSDGTAADSLWKNYSNPVAMSMESLDLGKKKYNIYCSPCHGMFADGDERLRGLFPKPPTLHSEKARQWPDSRIFDIITHGQNVMPSYASQLEIEERWAVVNYIRALQKARNAKEEGLK